MSKKKKLEKTKRKESKQLRNFAIVAVVFIIVFAIFYVVWYQGLLSGNTNNNTNTSIKTNPTAKLWTIDPAGRLNFTGRDAINASVVADESTDNYTLQAIKYDSYGDDVYALLRIPRNVTKPPVVVVLPAATITKEADSNTAIALAGMGYATLTLDERGQGQTGGSIDQRDWEAGYTAFMNNSTPVQYKAVYDALKAYDYVQTRSDLDTGNVSILGESIGGMWAIVAAGIEPKYKGVVTISSSDFDYTGSVNTTEGKFIYAVMPSHYLGSIPPRKLAMFQFAGDKIVPMADGKALYLKASEPKAWHAYNGSTHGLWDNAMSTDMKSELQGMLGR